MLEDNGKGKRIDFATTIANLYREYAYKYVIVIIFFLSAIASSIYPYLMAPY